MGPQIPYRRFRDVLVALLLLPAAQSCHSEPVRTEGSAGIEQYSAVRDLHELAERYRLKHHLPALGLGVTHRGRTVALGMAGARSAGSGERALLDDTFDVASCAKPVTATIAAMLVEDGRVRWDTTVREVFPELSHSIHPGLASATLEQLLRHRAGVAHEMNRNDRWSGWNRQHPGASARVQRFLFTAAALQRPPIHPPGTSSEYTSDGYIIAGAMLERTGGAEWEALVRDRLFRPLGMKTATYGAVSNSGRATFVAGHETGWLGSSRVVMPDASEYGAPPFGSPAGFLYASVPDLLRFLDFHIQGANGQGRLLRQESFERLHAQVDGQPFALGWSIDVKHGADRIVERSLYHGGYSGRSRANVWFTPETQWGTVIVMNHGRGDESISGDIFYALLREVGVVPAQPTTD